MSLAFQQSLGSVRLGEMRSLLARHWRMIAVQFVSPGEYTVLVQDQSFAEQTAVYRVVEVSLNRLATTSEPPRPWIPVERIWVPVHD